VFYAILAFDLSRSRFKRRLPFPFPFRVGWGFIFFCLFVLSLGLGCFFPLSFRLLCFFLLTHSEEALMAETLVVSVNFIHQRLAKEQP